MNFVVDFKPNFVKGLRFQEWAFIPSNVGFTSEYGITKLNLVFILEVLVVKFKCFHQLVTFKFFIKGFFIRSNHNVI